MDEKLKSICIGFIIMIIILIIISEVSLFITKILNKKELLSYQQKLKNYYEYYKNELENKVELNLDTPGHLDIPVYSSNFTNNAELRRAFLQICYIFRDLETFYEAPLTEETENLFREIRQIAYQNGEPFESHNIE